MYGRYKKLGSTSSSPFEYLEAGAKGNVGPAVTVFLHREHNENESQALKPIFEFAPDGWYLLKDLVSRVAYHILGMDTSVPYMMESKPISDICGRNALS